MQRNRRFQINPNFYFPLSIIIFTFHFKFPNRKNYKMASTVGKVIKCRAAVAWEPKKPLSIEQIEVDPPQKGEIRIKILYSAICHTDIFGYEGNDPTLMFPLIFGHEGAGIVESVGPGIQGFEPGDVVIPTPNPQCRKCKNCKNPETNICEKFPFGSKLGQVMDDGQSRFKCRGKAVYHFIGLSTFSEFIVVREEALAKINPKAPLDVVCLIGCGVTTGYGAPFKSSVVKPGSIVGVWGLGAIGLGVILGCKEQGAQQIVAIDMNEERLKHSAKFGATDFINPEKLPEGKSLVEYIREKYDGGLDFAFEATGNITAMSQAVECTKRAIGQTTLLGVSVENIQMSSPVLLLGRTVRGCVVGGLKPCDAMPELVEKYMAGKLMLDEFISWRYPLDQINKGLEHLEKGEGNNIAQQQSQFE